LIGKILFKKEEGGGEPRFQKLIRGKEKWGTPEEGVKIRKRGTFAWWG